MTSLCRLLAMAPALVPGSAVEQVADLEGGVGVGAHHREEVGGDAAGAAPGRLVLCRRGCR